MFNGKEPNSKLIYDQLILEMRDGRYSRMDKLPPEDMLAEEMQIRRTQLRDSLSWLESRGYVSRRRGLGTLINRHVLDLTIRADLETEFRKIITEMGMKPGVAFTRSQEIAGDARLCLKFNLQPCSPVLRIDLLITADGINVIYCEDYLPCSHIRRLDYTPEDLARSIFEFLDRFCGQYVHMHITRMNPIVADAGLAELFDEKPGIPLMFLDEIAYNFDGMPLIRSAEYYVAAVAEQTLLRRWNR